MVKLHKRAKGSASGTLLMLIVVVVASLYLLVKFFMSFQYIDPEDTTVNATHGRILPYGTLTVGSGVPVGERQGDWIFEHVCTQCHAADSNTADSPKVGNEAEWGPRIAKGLDKLLESAVNGLNAMPARGGRSDLTDEELSRAIVYMANQSGGSFPEPEAASSDESSGSSDSNESTESTESKDSAESKDATESTESSASGESSEQTDQNAQSDDQKAGQEAGK